MSTAQLQKVEEGRLSLSGELSMDTVPALLAQNNLRDTQGEISVDLQNVERADSAGVALLIEWQRSARQQQKTIHFQNIPPQMLAIAHLSGVDELLALEGASNNCERAS
jgi:phospholipid transport system transporter-binding protein